MPSREMTRHSAFPSTFNSLYWIHQEIQIKCSMRYWVESIDIFQFFILDSKKHYWFEPHFSKLANTFNSLYWIRVDVEMSDESKFLRRLFAFNSLYWIPRWEVYYPCLPRCLWAFNSLYWILNRDQQGNIVSITYVSFNSLYWIPYEAGFDDPLAEIDSFNSLYWIHQEIQIKCSMRYWVESIDIFQFFILDSKKHYWFEPHFSKLANTFNSLYWIRVDVEMSDESKFLRRLFAFNSLYWIPRWEVYYPCLPRCLWAFNSLYWILNRDQQGNIVSITYVSFNSLYWIPYEAGFDDPLAEIDSFNSLYWILVEEQS